MNFSNTFIFVVGVAVTAIVGIATVLLLLVGKLEEDLINRQAEERREDAED